ncbi:potassium channel subfamily K member 1 [Nephila pilipes]|uniref:Potassium channel subfamily K member 1 n=1 Tax=Nephila pilipes TaxID=299642 RepID=A0A8X6MR83_NEPPI|nr:potassium channel subfamily K member 1 [Nephila pilipes]
MAFFHYVILTGKTFYTKNKVGLSLFFLTIVLICYIAFGAFVFQGIEGRTQGIENSKKILNIKDSILKKYPQSVEVIDEMIKKLKEENLFVADAQKWTYGNCVLLAVTLITSIGYGHLAPKTTFGKAFCIIYSGIGFLITLKLMNMYTERLTSLSEGFKSNVFQAFRCRKPFFVRLFHFSIVMIIVLGTFVFLPAFIFYTLENSWTYFESTYCIYISLTTIGLGDFVPGLEADHPNGEFYRFGVAAYLMIGVTITMPMMTIATDFWQNYNKEYSILPVAVITEDIPIKSDSKPSYGAVLIHVSETTDDKKNLIP